VVEHESKGTCEEFVFRCPDLGDGTGIWELVRRSGVLDENSCYLYLLLCRDFRDTCLLAECGDELAGFVTAYIPPARPDVIFVWQVAVAEAYRGRGVASTALRCLIQLPACSGVRYLEATVAESNEASRRLFQSLAERLGTDCTTGRGFDQSLFPGSDHESEPLLRLGPFSR
jgi:L-2,4-diaminobutyric acid acetyltransferase